MLSVLRSRLAGVLPVGIGLLVLGVSSYVALGLAGHALAPREYAAIGSLYLIIAITGPGISAAIEQETNREISTRIAAGVGVAAAIRGDAVVAALLATVVCAGLVALSPLLVPGVLAGTPSLLIAALLAVVGSAAVYLLRGIFAGQRRYGWYAASLGAEGGVRIVGCVALAVVGGAGAGAFGFAFALGTAVAALVCLPALRYRPGPVAGGPDRAAPADPTSTGAAAPSPPVLTGTPPATPVPAGAPPATPVPAGALPATPVPAGVPPATPATPVPAGAPPGPDAPAAGPPLSVRRAAAATALLACASGLTFGVANLAPLVLTARLPDQPEIAASFVSLFVLARVPLFLFAPVQAFLLPSLAAGVERGDAAHVRSRLRVAMLAIAAVGLPGVALAAALGPWAARVLFNAPVDLPASVAAMLGLSTVAMMAAQLLQPALVAVGAHRHATFAWLVGAAVFGALLALPGDPVTGAVAAQLVGPLVVVGVMTAAVRATLPRVGTRPLGRTAA